MMERQWVNVPAKVKPEQYARFGAKVIETKLTPEWRIESFDEKARTMTFVRTVDVSTVEKSDNGKYLVANLTDSFATPSAGERAAAAFADQYPGYSLWKFMPHLKKAFLRKIPEDILTTRAAVANVLGVKPWDIEVERRRGGGYVLSSLPSSYMPSRHDQKLEEVATTKVPGGHPGWFVRIDGPSLTGEIIPADLPTFPPMIATDMAALGSDKDRTTFGLALPAPGEDQGKSAVIDWTASAAMLLGGTPGSGKRQPMTARIPVPVSDEFPDGWATMGQMHKGCQVFTPRGTVATVVSATRPTTRPTWRFTLADGQQVDSDSEHIWPVSTRWTRGDKGTLESRAATIRDRVADARKERLDPFALASLFGVTPDVIFAAIEDSGLRGFKDGTYLVSSLEKRVLGNRDGSPVIMRTSETIANDIMAGSSADYALPVSAPVHGTDHFDVDKSLEDYLSKGVIGARALRGHVNDRIRLLAGIIRAHGSTDEDGTIGVRASIASGVLELVRSLGCWAWVDADTVRFTSHLDLGRGVPRVRNVTRWNRIVAVTYLGETEGRCIRVDDDDHLYLTEDFVPTHNTVTLNALLADQLAAGAECVVVDDPAKSVDFLWAKPFLRKGGWGCDSDRHAVAALALAYEEGQKRAKELAAKRVVNWLDLPPDERFTPIFIIVDELSALTVPEKEPTSLPKDHPLRLEIAEANLQRAALARYYTKIIAEERFVGVRIVLSTQVTNASTGVSPSTKAKIGHKILQGSQPSKSARTQAFSVEDRVPQVPPNVAGGGKAAKGVGAAELEGVAPFVYKSMFAPASAYGDYLRSIGVPVHSDTYVTPTGGDLARLAPTLDDEVDDGPAPSKFDAGGFGDAGGHLDELKGAAKANHDRAVEMAQARVASKKDEKLRDADAAAAALARIQQAQDIA